MKISIQEEHRLMIKDLIREEKLASIKLSCLKSQFDKAVSEGNEEQALDIYDRIGTAKDIGRIAQSNLWGYIGERYPETKDGSWSINHSDWILFANPNNMLAELAMAVGCGSREPSPESPATSDSAPAPTAA